MKKILTKMKQIYEQENREKFNMKILFQKKCFLDSEYP